VLPTGNTFAGQTITLTGSANGWSVVNRNQWNLNNDAFTTTGFTIYDNRVVSTRSIAASNGWTLNQSYFINNGTASESYTSYAALTSGTGNFTTVVGYKVGATGPPSNTNTYVNYYGVEMSNVPSNVTNYYGVRISDFTGTTISRALDLGLASGTGKWNIYAQGTADNYLAGDTAIGTATLGTATKLTVGGSETAVSAIARGQLINATLVAAANNDVLVGLDINPTFTTGAFTGVTSNALRVSGYSNFINNASAGVLRLQNLSSTGWSSFEIYNSASSLVGGFGWGNASASALASTMYFDVVGNNPFIIRTNSVERIRFFGGGNVGINTGATDAGYRLDVNGTARIQNKLSVGTPTEATAVMEVTSTSQGFLPPRMTSAQRTAIASPATGLMVYQTDGVEGLYVKTSTAWRAITMT